MTQRHLPRAFAMALALVVGLAAAESENEGVGFRDPFEEVIEGSKPFEAHAPPTSLLELAATLAPVLKYYVVLLGLFALARFLNRMVEDEGNLKEKELRVRHVLRCSDEEGEASDSDSDGAADAPAAARKANGPKTPRSDAADDDDVHEELITDGSKLVKMTASELTERRKTKTKKNHPLFEGLQKIEEELKQKQQKKKDGEGGEGGESDDGSGVSWNELHQSMLKRYQQKFPEHGLRVQDSDDYDDEFKELLKKHQIDPEAIRREIRKDK
ncbi:hypothetical protein PybrP1_000132 [[Pythium] brassicae (nom. inval.)]|nr:hypothetical protein PybrP1_000132 [[Pythium] brassicae (nom. inval.)]